MRDERPRDHGPVDLRGGHVAQPERVAALAQPDVDRDRARRSGRRGGSARPVAGTCWCAGRGAVTR